MNFKVPEQWELDMVLNGKLDKTVFSVIINKWVQLCLAHFLYLEIFIYECYGQINKSIGKYYEFR